MGRKKTSTLIRINTSITPKEHDTISKAKLSVHGIIQKGIHSLVTDAQAASERLAADKWGTPPPIFFADLAWSPNILKKWVKRSLEDPSEKYVKSFPIYQEMGFTKEQVNAWIDLTMRGFWHASFMREIKEMRLAEINRQLRRSDKPLVSDLSDYEMEDAYRRFFTDAKRREKEQKQAELMEMESELHGSN